MCRCLSKLEQIYRDPSRFGFDSHIPFLYDSLQLYRARDFSPAMRAARASNSKLSKPSRLAVEGGDLFGA
jgi:hypothetical protein